jgi:hypothetical protein
METAQKELHKYPKVTTIIRFTTGGGLVEEF